VARGAPGAAGSPLRQLRDPDRAELAGAHLVRHAIRLEPADRVEQQLPPRVSRRPHHDSHHHTPYA
jgi:hypothetical protein